MNTRTIAITRPVGKGRDTAKFVRSLGWTPFIFHTVELKPLETQKILDQIQSSVTQGPVDWVVFMSSTGVKLLFDSLRSRQGLPESLRKSSFLAVGPRTREMLLRYGVAQAFVPEEYSSAGVDNWFSRLDILNLRVVLVRSSSADESLTNSLVERGVKVATVNVYESGMPADLQSILDFLEGLRISQFAAVLFTSAISASNFFKIAETIFTENEVTSLLRRVAVGAIGPATAEQLWKRGLEPIVPDEYLIEDAVKKLVAQ